MFRYESTWLKSLKVNLSDKFVGIWNLKALMRKKLKKIAGWWPLFVYSKGAVGNHSLVKSCPSSMLSIHRLPKVHTLLSHLTVPGYWNNNRERLTVVSTKSYAAYFRNAEIIIMNYLIASTGVFSNNNRGTENVKKIHSTNFRARIDTELGFFRPGQYSSHPEYA